LAQLGFGYVVLYTNALLGSAVKAYDVGLPPLDTVLHAPNGRNVVLNGLVRHCVSDGGNTAETMT